MGVVILSQTFTLRSVLVLSETGYQTQDVQVSEGIIAAIGADLSVIGESIDGRGKLLLPGFVNAHTHSPEMWCRGLIPPLPLELWLGVLYQCPPLTPEQTYLAALWTAAETLLSGGTTLVDHLLLTPGQELETIAAAAQAYEEIGIRACIAPLIQDHSMDVSIPTGQVSSQLPSTRQTRAVLEMMETAIQRHHQPAKGIYIAPGPTGFQLCSETLFRGCVELSQRYDLCLHTHLLETKAQQMLAYERYGVSGVEYLNRIGFLGSKTSLAHGVWLDDADIDLLAMTGATVVHNPLSNLRLGSGIAPLLKYRRAGVNVTFGCDGSASNDGQDLLEAIKLGTMLHNPTDFEYRNWLSLQTAASMASLGGAKGLGLQEQIGSLTVGKQADLVLYDLSDWSMLPASDPLGLLLLGRPVNLVDRLWVGGRAILQDRQFKTVDLANLRQQLLQGRSSWVTTPPVLSQALEEQYRSVMGLGAGA
ncbi:amidohydrolase [Pseudanabaena sp. FACHB-2040]|uniref:amidohydrolase n=1 Tax=Pseudanabaena sp. FACHB-2040 TaxID=2692859 RepID=UPI001F556BC2|nr:amidohydrolase [Pseudanabaena sp. FACHB-2040]